MAKTAESGSVTHFFCALGNHYRYFLLSLTRRRETFRALTATTKSLHTTLITTYGLAGFKHNDAVQRIVTMDDLFA